jgi:hypothetical protein
MTKHNLLGLSPAPWFAAPNILPTHIFSVWQSWTSPTQLHHGSSSPSPAGPIFAAESLPIKRTAKSTMSRFFHGGLSDSETSSSDEEDLYSEEESSEEESSSEDEEESAQEEESDSESDEEGGSRFLRGAESDESDEEDGKRTVKSAKDKRMEEIEAMIKAIDNAQKINDWVTISSG